MHELALTESILRIVETEAERQGFSSVRAVWLELGALSHADPDAIRFCFDTVTRGSLAEGARLTIERPPGQGWCMICSVTVPLARRFDPCPHCGGHQVQVTDGDDMRLTELEVA
ncbi:hydrogenase maturation nickel metallochaperone HypA [Roseospira marina]|uniref:Hydrogenase maturation factor HypA n=1 Tax=Roseospira marina TaxID=140057 RepID=A0A5M6IDF1_9PROT|nr:hydrogenase maturation nickel metallochaperone HypA [Roseospira marina]KAA5606273.1 hydrogenase maturation nickel metallochaperone HypA [Roseospira marina]MBB4314431.1 hydrogenase nickel incorporation protein HypA/HybF [Roseospira marina]MBB5087591.1 hydrogenase nickel incorporation protein HypA/HybF [Roseospira marina]